MDKKISLVFWGSSKFSKIVLERILASGDYEVLAVVTRADRPVGRNQKLDETDVARFAKEKELTVLKPVKLDAEFVQINREVLESDLNIVAAYGKIMPKRVLDLARSGSLNIHPSLLPKYRGASPIQSAIANGETVSGVTVMLMDEQMDHGAILASQKININEKETFESFEEKSAEIGADLLLRTITDFISGKNLGQVQDENLVTSTRLIQKEDGYFDIENPPSSRQLDQMIRAYYPWPIVWTKWNGRIVKFYPGRKVQMESKKIVDVDDFLRGYSKFPKGLLENLN